MDWTKEQYEAINKDGVNILVSAAAGSGKTTVLIARIARLIIDEEVSVDRFLITTFTNAAASEMRQRLEANINKELKNCREKIDKMENKGADPDEIQKLREKKTFLQDQIRLLPEAHIETFHSFSIGLIRDYFFLTDLQPGFSIGDETRISLMKKEVIDAIFERRFREDAARFKAFLRKYSKERNDERLKENILYIYTSMLSIPRYMEWAEKKVGLLGQPSPVEALELTGFIRAQTVARLLDAARYYDEAARLLDDPKTADIHAKASQDAETIRALAEKIEGMDDIEAIGDCLESSELNAMRASKDEKDAFDKVKDEVQSLRKQGKKYKDDLKKTYFIQDPKKADETIRSLKDDTEYYLDIVRELDAGLNERKRDENIIDFDDAMHYAIKILDDDRAAEDYKDKFRYIFIDEYQDSNYLQETIIDRIRRDDNLFMVGDIKQSIYRFRLAEPDLFKDKYVAFGREEERDSEKIDLNSNFRSKGNIRRTVNTVFEDVMEGYDEKAALRGPEDGGPDGPKTQLHIIRRYSEEDLDNEEGATLDESALVARLIKEYVGKPYTDKNGEPQILGYSDIAVLSRATRAVSEIERHLNSEGIPAYGDTDSGYYETVEVSVFIDLLSIISNIRQDVPLIAVMSAVFFDFTPAELATIRISFRDKSFCDAVFAYTEAGEDEAIKAKITSMIAQIESWKEMSRTLPLEELIRILLYETGYYDYCSSLPVGKRRISNLRLLLEKAQAFEQNSYSGLYGFLSYIDAMKRTNQKVNEASVAGEGEDAVRVMTVHKSKGLEYPMVILVGAGKSLSGRSSGFDPSMDRDFSIALPLIDKEMHTRSKTLLQLVISGKKKAEELDEEIRILYVALTRAIDRLIVVGTIDEGKDLSHVPMKSSFLEMIYPAMCRIEGEDPEKAKVEFHDSIAREFEDGDPATSGGADEPANTGGDGDPVASDRDGDPVASDRDGGSTTPDSANEPDEELYAEIDRRLSFRYPYEHATQMRPKYSVTSLADTDGEWEIATLPPAMPKIPDLRNLGDERDSLTAAEAGTVMHYIMEKIDFARAQAEGASYVKEVADSLHEDGVLDGIEYAAVVPQDIARFFADPIGERAAKATNLAKEKEFLMQEMIEGEPVIIQGIIDCYFEEDDGLVLIDYKNVSVKDGSDGSEIVEKYREQIRLYKRALERAEDKPVKEAWLYAFKSGRFLKVQTD